MYQDYLNLIANSITGSLDTRFQPDWRFDFVNNPQDFNKLMGIGTLRTFIGKKRLANIQYCIENILQNDIPGDLIEAGCWRGGAVLYMKACLEALRKDSRTNVNERAIWCADAFPENNQLLNNQTKLLTIKLLSKLQYILPVKMKSYLANQIMEAFPNEDYSKETLNYILKMANILPWKAGKEILATSASDIIEMFERYDLYDENIRILPGWFSETLPTASHQIKSLALLRVDADFYKSTLEVLETLYHKLSTGGYCIIDDYGGIAECKQAVDQFREQNNICEEIIFIDNVACYWQKLS